MRKLNHHLLVFVLLSLSGCYFKMEVNGLSSLKFSGDEQFSPSSFYYSIPDGVLLKNEPVGALSPSVKSDQYRWTIAPNLPRGLQLDAATGSIVGTPLERRALTNYIVTATHAGTGEQHATTVSFEVGVRYTVNTTMDTSDDVPMNERCLDLGGNCSLRAAVEEANSVPTLLTVIDLPAGSYGLLFQTLEIKSRVHLRGAGPTLTTIDANPDTSPLLRALLVGPGVDAIFEGFAIKNAGGSTGTDGKGIKSLARKLTLKNLLISDNEGLWIGGGVSAQIPQDGILIVDNCTFSNNRNLQNGVFWDGHGGGIYAETTGTAATLIIKNSRFNNNHGDFVGSRGGALHVAGKMTVTIEDSLFDSNSSAGGGGAVQFNGVTSASILRSDFLNNLVGPSISESGGAILIMNPPAGASYTISQSLFKDNKITYEANGDGVAISASGGGNAKLNLESSTMDESANILSHALTVDGLSVDLVNNTINAARAISLNAVPVANVSHNTVFASADSALSFNSGNGNIKLFANILQSQGNACLRNAYALAGMSLGYNVVSDSSCSLNEQIGDLNNTVINLGLLSSNGGRTLTRLLEPASVAKDLIPLTKCLINTDQRGMSRPVGTGCDAGAIEMQ